MSIQSKLDQVLALVDLPDTPLNGVLVAEHCYAFMKEHGPAIRAAVGGVGETVAWWREDHVCHAHELTTADALADGYKPCVIKCEDCAWNASLCDTHGAVGGEAVPPVAWMDPRSGRTIHANEYSGVVKIGPLGDPGKLVPCREVYTAPLYASPPATVDVGANDFLDGMIAALGCLWLGFGYGPGTAEYDEVLNSAGRAKVLERAKKMHPEDIANAGLDQLIGEKA